MTVKPLLAALLVLPQLAFAATVSGKLTSGGGIDNRSITVTLAGGDKIEVYCPAVCDEKMFVTDKDDVADLRKRYKGKQVVLSYRPEKNNGRLAGPGEDDIELFATKLVFVR